MILLDTNVVSEPLRPQPETQVLAWLDAQAVETLYLSTTSLSELLLGVEVLPPGRRRSTLAAALRAEIGGLFGPRIVAFDVDAAEACAQLTARARRRGLAISVADAQIAAIATTRNLVVATRDEAPFRAAGLRVVNPWKEQA